MSVLINLIYDFLQILKVIVICDFYLVLPKKYIWFNKFLVSMIALCSSLLIYYTENPNIVMVEYIMSIFILLFLLYDTKIHMLFITAIWTIFLLSLLDEMSILLVQAVRQITNINTDTGEIFFMHIVTLVVIYLSGKCLQSISKYGVKKIGKKYFVLFTVLTIADSMVLYSISDFFSNLLVGKNRIIVEIMFVILILGIFMQMILVLLMIVSRNEYKEKERLVSRFLQEQKNHYEYLEQREKETKKLRHDLRDHLYTLSRLYHEQDYEKFDIYVERILGNIDNFGNKISVNNGIVDAILNKYNAEAEKEGIQLKVSGHFPIECHIDAYDLCVIFSNILKNAIEAEKQCDKKEITIGCRYSDKEIIVISENYYTGKIIVENGVLKSSKTDKENHGMGFENVTECVKKNHGYINFETEEDKFKVQLSIKNTEGK